MVLRRPSCHFPRAAAELGAEGPTQSGTGELANRECSREVDRSPLESAQRLDLRMEQRQKPGGMAPPIPEKSPSLGRAQTQGRWAQATAEQHEVGIPWNREFLQ